jgi:hypothetical protein
VTLASAALLALVWSLFAFDALTLRGRARRMLVLEAALFTGGSVFIAAPDFVTQLANRIGIGRGADLVSYMAVIWLVRESLVHRRRRLEDGDQITQLVRAVALLQAADVPAADGAQGDGQSAAVSDSTTT